MRRKVIWLVFWTTMAYWLGGALGCASPMGTPDERGIQRLIHKPVDASKNGVALASANESDAPSSKSVPATQPQAGNSNVTLTFTYGKFDEAESQPATQPAATQVTMRGDTEPSLIGLDRSHWSKIATGPDAGLTYHQPIYFRDWPVRERHEKPFTGQMTAGEAEMFRMTGGALWDEVLANPYRPKLLETRPWQGLAQPVKFVGDIVALPVKMMFRPPWVMVTTP